MISYYPYLTASLPSLYFGMKPPFSSNELLRKCEGVIPEGDVYVIKKVSLRISRDEVIEKNTVLNRWKMFDADLRNELVKIRAQRKHIDPVKYLRNERYVPVDISHLLVSIARNPSIIESERLLDQIKWNFFDELVLGHYFDVEFMVVYALKLLLLEKWERINTADKAELLEQALAGYQL